MLSTIWVEHWLFSLASMPITPQWVAEEVRVISVRNFNVFWAVGSIANTQAVKGVGAHCRIRNNVVKASWAIAIPRYAESA
jgi:hypothetical protein